MARNRLQMVISSTDMKRLSIKESKNEMVIVVDVHGMKCKQAKRLINNIINIVKSRFELIVIHGYHHGTAIKDMIISDFSNPHIRNKYTDICNQGMTYLFIA